MEINIWINEAETLSLQQNKISNVLLVLVPPHDFQRPLIKTLLEVLLSKKKTFIFNLIKIYAQSIRCCQWAEMVRIISPIRPSLYASAVNNKCVQWEQRETETPGEGRIYHKKQLDVTATRDSALAQRLSGFTLTRLPLCGLQIGPGSMCSHPAHSWDPNTAASQAFQPKQPGVRSQSHDVPAAACSDQSMFYFLCGKKRKRNTIRDYFQTHNFLFRGYERKPWQATVFHEISKQGIPRRVWDLWKSWLIKYTTCFMYLIIVIKLPTQRKPKTDNRN